MEGFMRYTPPSDPILHRKRYDVFLSFRGPDVRNTLANKLFRALQREGLHVFLDSERLEKGENIGMSLEEAIKDSRLHIPIFSRGYANSAWCLKELSLMWNCKATGAGTRITPLFYDVEPWHVRYPDSERSPYAEALKKHNTRHSGEEIEEWKKALFEVSSLSGWALAQTTSGDEDKLVQKITEDLQSYNVKDLHVAKHPVGLVARTIEVIREYMDIAVHQRRIIIGIWGMGGSGKTTLLKSIYNHIHCRFQACCFVADISATARESVMGLKNLQQLVLKKFVKRDVPLCSVDEGKIEMQNRLASIKALVLLDDVDDDEHLDALLGDWYGPGSIIIITTRNKEVLEHRHVDKIYPMECLSPKEGVKLFSWHAFGREDPDQDYEDMTQQIVDACDGLPLSLEILGAHLCSERNPIIWKEALQKIQNVAYDKLYKSLRISYDALTFHEKQMFLDIACFFIVLSRLFCFSKEFYIKFWEVLGRKATYTGLRNLERKSLIVMHEDADKATCDGQIGCEFGVHDHLRDLGRRIVEEESPDNPNMRSRLWYKEDIISAIAQAEETSAVQGIMLRQTRELEAKQVDSLASMHNLKFMFCWDLFLKRKITKLPQNLRYLVLSRCQLKQQRSFLKISLMPKAIGHLKYMPKAIGQLKYLRYLDMSHTPLGLLPNEFGKLLSLEELYLVGCSLIKLPHSFGNLIKLKFLDISQNPLKRFPKKFSQLMSLEFLNVDSNKFKELPTLPRSLIHLNVRYCYSLQKLCPISHMTNLLTIELSGCTKLTELPKVDTMHSLTTLSLEGCGDLKELPILPRSLTFLSLEGCRSLQRISCMRDMDNLESILLCGCPSLGELPELEALHSLTKLSLDGCGDLKQLPVLPRNLTSLSLKGCWSLQRMSCMHDMKNLECISLSECPSLGELPKLKTLHSLTELSLYGCGAIKELPVLPTGLTSISLRTCCNLQRVPYMHDTKNLELILLSECSSLGELPELEALHSLTKLSLYGCNNLKELPVLPRSLISLSLGGCSRLERMSCMHHMENLEWILLSGCPNLGELPELEALHSLTELSLYGCVAIKELPVLPTSLTSLSLRWCRSLQRMSCMCDMKNLELILLSECPSLGELPKLEALHSLTKLSLGGCGVLKVLPVLPRSLTSLCLRWCGNLQRMSCMLHDMQNLERILLSGCPSLVELPELEALQSLKILKLSSCWNLEKLPALPEGPIDVSIEDCIKLQNSSPQDELSCTDEPKRPASEWNNGISLLDLNRRLSKPRHRPEQFTLADLATATGGFSYASKVRRFGTIDIGTLSDGRRVAIKHFHTRNPLDFESKFNFLSGVHHRHLVSLVGYCEEDDVRLIVYEYMSHGSLHEHLHNPREIKPPMDSWAMRIKLALDVARGIEYLHTYAVPPIIHRDIKSSNILLDATWNAKVCNFGISVWGPNDEYSHLSLPVAGTVGYIDPGYCLTGRVSTKSDVYSFGVVLLELLSGKMAVHEDEDKKLRPLVLNVLPYIENDDLGSIVDRRLPRPRPSEMEALLFVGATAAECVIKEGKDRPSMTQVANNLEMALENIVRIRN